MTMSGWPPDEPERDEAELECQGECFKEFRVVTWTAYGTFSMGEDGPEFAPDDDDDGVCPWCGGDDWAVIKA